MITTNILWDFESLKINKFEVFQRKIKDFCQRSGLSSSGNYCFGNTQQLTNYMETQMLENGYHVQHIHSTKYNATELVILNEILKISIHTKPPHCLMLLTASDCFAETIKFILSVGYKVILIHDSGPKGRLI
jgi:hypothetical protein